jgi:squalene-hopene/tetraprenyl-beta-curcumene cyclase
MDQQGMCVTLGTWVLLVTTAFVDSQGARHDWREDFLNQILSLQHEEGCWVNPDGQYQENVKDLATAYAVIAMKYALQGDR